MRNPRPELSARCPVCGKVIHISPTKITGDVFCRLCRAPLCFVVMEGKAHLYQQERISPHKKELIETIASADSLDVVELVMEWEEEFGPAFGAKKLPHFRSLTELIDYIIRELPD